MLVETHWERPDSFTCRLEFKSLNEAANGVHRCRMAGIWVDSSVFCRGVWYHMQLVCKTADNHLIFRLKTGVGSSSNV